MSTQNLSCIEWTATTRDTLRVLRSSDLPRGCRATNPNVHSWIITIVSEVSRPRFCLFTSATGQIPVRVAPKYGSENLFDMLATLHFRDRRGEASLRFISEIAPARIHTRFHCFTEIGQSFHLTANIIYFYFKKDLFNSKSGKSFGQFFFQFLSIRHAMRFLQLDLQGFIRGERNWPISCLNDSGTQERGLQGVKIENISLGSMSGLP